MITWSHADGRGCCMQGHWQTHTHTHTHTHRHQTMTSTWKRGYAQHIHASTHISSRESTASVQRATEVISSPQWDHRQLRRGQARTDMGLDGETGCSTHETHTQVCACASPEVCKGAVCTRDRRHSTSGEEMLKRKYRTPQRVTKLEVTRAAWPWRFQR
mgnify:CR=1 FL=1